MAPIAWHGLVFIGNAGGDRVGVIGHVYALDAATGTRGVEVRRRAGDGPGARTTWGHGAAAAYPISGGAFWTSFTLDEANGVLYVSSGNPAPDFDSAMRDGENLYANSLIALDAATGRMLALQPAREARLSRLGRRQSVAARDDPSRGAPIVASANKDGLLSVLDRSARTLGSRAARRRRAAELPVLYQVPTTTRENVDVPLSRDHPTRFCPGILGGAEWNGAAYDPTRNTFFVGANDWCSTVQLQREARRCRAIGAAWFGNTPAGSAWTRRDSQGMAHGVRRRERSRAMEVRSAEAGARRRHADRRRSRVHGGSWRHCLRVRCRRWARAVANVDRASRSAAES